jgi:hypothetical protein
MENAISGIVKGVGSRCTPHHSIQKIRADFLKKKFFGSDDFAPGYPPLKFLGRKNNNKQLINNTHYAIMNYEIWRRSKNGRRRPFVNDTRTLPSLHSHALTHCTLPATTSPNGKFGR